MIWNKSYWTEDEQLLFWKAASSGYLLYEKITKPTLSLFHLLQSLAYQYMQRH